MADLHAVVQKMIDAGESEDNIATVIKAAAPSPVSAGDMMSGRVGRETNLSDSSEPQAPDWKTKLGAALEPLAHPQSVSDMAGLMIPSGVPLKAIGSGAAQLGRGAARLGATVLEDVPYIRKLTPGAGLLTRGLRKIGTEPTPQTPFHELPLAQQMEQLPETQAPILGRGPEPPLRAWSSVAPVESAPNQPATTALNSIDRANLRKAGYGPEQIAQIEQRAAQQQPVPFKPIQPAASRGQPAMAVDLKSVPDSWKPFAQPNTAEVPFSQPPHLLDPRRVDIGAEKTGRMVGMSKQEVRDVATPILGGQQGDASAVLPDAAFTRIVQTMKQLAPGAEREAYVAKATSGKTQWQVHNIMRTLRDLGLIGTAAVGGGEGARRALTSQMAGEQ